MNRVAAFLVDHAKRVIGVTALLTLIAATVVLTQLHFNADVTAFLKESSDAGRAFAALQDKYEAKDPITVMLERKDGGRMDDRRGLELILAAKQALMAVEGVSQVGTILPELNPYTGAPFDEEALKHLPDALFPVLTESPAAAMLFSVDKRAALAVVSPTGDAVEVAAAVQATPLPDALEVTFAGNPVVFASVIDTLGWFLLAIPPAVVLLLLLVFAANIGSRKLAVLAIVPALMGSVWTFGLIFGLGYPVDIVTVIVPIWIIVMGSADGLHFVTHLQEAAARTSDRKEQTRSALREVGLPMILTTLSTAAGFLSFLGTDVGPMRQLGVFAALGISFAGAISFFFLPALLSRIELGPPHEHALGGRVVGALQRLAHKRSAAFVLALLCLGFTAAFLPRLAVNPDQLFFFKDDHPARAAFEKMSEAFGGATPLVGEMAFDPQKSHAEQLERIRGIERELEALPGVRRVFSLADVVEKLPEERARELLSGATKPALGRMVSDDGMRFVLFPGAFTTEDLQRWQELVEDKPEVRVLTGTPLLFDEMSRLVAKAQVTSLGAAFLLVGVMLLIAYRRVRLTLVALVPMALTIGVLLAFLAASGIQLNLMTAVVSSIVIGVGIDYGIHLLAAIEHARDGTPGYALRGLATSGRPIVANALGIAVGMSALFFSPLRPHAQIATIMWVSMITGALTTLLIVPALLPKDATKAS